MIKPVERAQNYGKPYFETKHVRDVYYAKENMGDSVDPNAYTWLELSLTEKNLKNNI